MSQQVQVCTVVLEQAAFVILIQDPNCGTICNQCTGQWDAIAYGGDLNRCGNISCMGFHGCRPSCVCLFRGMVAFPPGMITECGGVVGYGMDDDPFQLVWEWVGAVQ